MREDLAVNNKDLNSTNNKIGVKSITYAGLLSSFVAISTMVISIPTPGNGYIHLGDGVILLISVFLGWRYGMYCGAIGSFLADILQGYSQWAIFSLLIKGAVGFCVGKLSATYRDNRYKNIQENAIKQSLLSSVNKIVNMRNLLAVFTGEIIMVIGYLIAGTILNLANSTNMLSSFYISLTSLPANIMQAFGGIVFFVILGIWLNGRKIKL